MGHGKKKRDLFLANHPRCYMCGAKSTTIDHVPSRECFRDRVWPEGFEFPCCEPCNHSASQIEQAIAFYLLMHNDKTSITQFSKLMHGVANNQPTLLPKVLRGANVKKRAAKSIDYVPPDGQTYADAPIVEMPEESDAAFQTFARRLTCALYYRHIGVPMPTTHVIMTHKFLGNHDNAIEKIKVIMPHMNAAQLTKRQNTSLGDQFSYVYNAMKMEEFLILLANFSDAFYVLGIATGVSEETTGKGYISHANDAPKVAVANPPPNLPQS